MFLQSYEYWRVTILIPSESGGRLYALAGTFSSRGQTDTASWRGGGGGGGGERGYQKRSKMADHTAMQIEFHRMAVKCNIYC